jgi:hypothetical protein
MKAVVAAAIQAMGTVVSLLTSWPEHMQMPPLPPLRPGREKKEKLLGIFWAYCAVGGVAFSSA